MLTRLCGSKEKAFTCGHPGCVGEARWSRKKDGAAAWCAAHRRDGMALVVSYRVCSEPGCNTSPTFALASIRGKRWCASHAPIGAENVISARCSEPGCQRISPAYNYPGQKKGKWCASHKADTMIDVRSRRCTANGCDVIPTYGFPGAVVERCASHKVEEMICIYGAHCEEGDCLITPSYGDFNTKKARWCKKHAQSGSIDVVHPRCTEEACSLTASYGFLFCPKTKCARHREKRSQFSRNNPRCEHRDCRSRPLYTSDNSLYPKRCEEHKTLADVNVAEVKCPSCGLAYLMNGRADDVVCEYCIETPENAGKPMRKELVIKELLESNGFEIAAHDRRVDGGCTRRRPDFLLWGEGHAVIVEIDEHQHRNYECEVQRKLDVLQDLGSPAWLLRYNPDGYKPARGKPWGQADRQAKLVDELRRLLKKTPPAYNASVELFYDGFDGAVIDNPFDLFEEARRCLGITG